MCIHMRYAGFEPAISIDIFPVYYSHNTAACNGLSGTTLQPADNKCADVRAASIPWFHLFTR